mgnify:CR=1 FL=1
MVVAVLFALLSRADAAHEDGRKGCSGLEGDGPAQNPVNEEPDSRCLIAEAVERLNESLPRSIDNVTTLALVTFDGTSIVYRYAVGAQALRGGEGIDLIAESEWRIRSHACSDALNRTLLRNGGEVRFVYDGPDGRIGEIVVNGDDCTPASELPVRS